MSKISNAAASGLAWTKSSYSGATNDCVEVAAGQIPGAVPVRDSKAPTGPALVLSEPEWGIFLDAVKGGQL
ncbi:DUF397 domain-containing protein [Streptomyces sp. NPDC002073]|uniref:DUF397 domain-containing protein n=1 Tax=Streptomyces sp. NBC_00239 TaxID=2903640 RepID=UPI002E2D1365|nr:DUF397 domain-containing protein [Streptomyces sp. NBC_00239]